VLASGEMPLLSQSSGADSDARPAGSRESIRSSVPSLYRGRVRQQRTILLVEPDALLRESWRSGLAAMGFQVRESADAAGALSTAMRSQIDLLITELYLPTPKERCLVRATQREPALRYMKILVVSDHATAEDRDWALAAGADAYLIKPVRLGRMLQVAGRLAVSRDRGGEGRAQAGRARADEARAGISGAGDDV